MLNAGIFIEELNVKIRFISDCIELINPLKPCEYFI